MARPCTVCTHLHRKAIDKALRAGKTLRSISEMYAVTSMSLSRHQHKCLELVKVKAAAKAATNRGANTSLVKERTMTALKNYAEEAKVDEPPELEPPNLDEAPDAYTELLNLKKTLSYTLKAAIKAANSDLIVAASRELRNTTETMLKVWETQKRIEAQYEKASPISATWTYAWLKKRYPAVLAELVKDLKEAHQG